MEQALLNVAQIFTGEINKLESKLAGASANIELSIAMPSRYSDDKRPKIILSCSFYDGQSHSTVKAASLGALMDEVYRRAGFADKEALQLDRVEASLVALPAPTTTDL